MNFKVHSISRLVKIQQRYLRQSALESGIDVLIKLHLGTKLLTDEVSFN